MNILLVTSYFEPDSGAAAVRLTRLAKLLRQRGHQVTVLTTLPCYPKGVIAEGYQDAWEVDEQRDGLRIIRTWLWATPSPRISRKFISQMSFMLTASLRGLSIPRPDVVLIEAQPVFTCVAAVLISLFKRVPYVMHISAMWPEHLLTVGAMTEHHPIYRLALAAMKAMYRGAAQILTLSPIWVDTIKGYIGETDKIRFNDNGVDLELFRPNLDSRAFRENYQLGDARLVTFIGTFATQYDFEAMFKVAEHFRDHENLLFVFIGGGSQNNVVEERIARRDLPNLRWLGLIDREEIPSAWAASYITYLAFRDHDLYRGTIPGKFFEALACGVPIAAALEGVGGDVVTNSGAGISVKFADADGLTEAVSRLLDEAEFYQKCRKAARTYAENYYSPEKVASEFEAALRRAVGGE